ncbi:LexA family protein [Ruminococcus champanellensis]|uniref:SOS-response transcriptional repressors (RecA-mediated autopeptidases) n=1 Tax=Ruminococcus champanellensis (strain DSM 18848 / JCM 17042 / KCTC 15320 / 18P13) TaxID=213810 RepID=D4LDS3_RUMC1|nr:XRE family transcriptional regulator [Ruminococcus champanellensis]CBL17768.1 SOS-response transcriptional repressors (RecA-mediated autopeptidases) [Ruminococcus champanellensis 18P13 = JCM 17042]
MNIGERIKTARKEIDKTQQELADAIGTTKQNVYKYENGIITNIPSDKIEAIAKFLHVSPAYLFGWEEESLYDQFDNIHPIKLKKFPLLGDIACGEPIFADEDRESYIMADMDIRADFCLRAKGDSMINARIQDGDIVFIRKMPMVENGEIAAVIIDGEATLKRVQYYPQKGKLILYPENPNYEPFFYSGEELNEIRILGKAVYFMSAL